MRRVEMVGVSGVGKTTLYTKLVRIPAEHRSFLTLTDAYKKAAVSHDISFKKIKLWIYQFLLNLGLLDPKARGVGKVILHELSREEQQQDTADSDPFLTSYIVLLEYLKQSENREFMYNQIARFNEKIEEYLILKNYLPNSAPVLIDEGLNHCHPGVTEYGMEKFSDAEIKMDYTFNPAGIIYCKQSADVIFEQAMNRKKQGIYTFCHGRLTPKELRNYVERSITYHEKKINSYREINIPVLDLDTRDCFESNVKKINDFARFLSD